MQSLFYHKHGIVRAAAVDLCLSAQIKTKNRRRRKERHYGVYHLSIKITSRGKGKSAVAVAEHQAGEKIKNEYDGMVHDYTRKHDIVHNEILLPDNAPPEYKDRAVLLRCWIV